MSYLNPLEVTSPDPNAFDSAPVTIKMAATANVEWDKIIISAAFDCN
jgi:hypothetical protein